MSLLPALIEAQSLIQAGDIAAAESALANIAETEGDKALVAALDSFPPKDLLAIIREYDASKESLVNLVVTPEQFAQAVVLERRYGDQTHEQLRGMVNSVIFRDGADPAEFLYEIAEVEGGYDALVDYLLDRTQMVEHFYRYATFDLYEYGDGAKTEALEDDLMTIGRDRNEESGPPSDMANLEDRDWMQVTYILRYELPEIFREVLMKLRARYQAYLANLQQDELESLVAEPEEDERPKNNDDGDDKDDEESAL
ncbi:MULTISPECIES: hypothetical protein [unclassified Undibacterium]|uniref:hypothetical protein n=1 Tax=unclassified Undibacterium TaxID=2630295 RepID=UPI002AC89E25|nr:MULTISPECIES: hypothetical protein [unclassified Undibacterium]MEB0138597.1 hypothetical protein [Undibacterium sp. CCC2.1]MEB0171339.1 hypothetical protein [Undibacterium sp. CCC1.1]MEB0175361.1 hypothetical protein [Undibacterium sp. CCC3.4]MEB0214535.1 hypothetical protein [Undibacterium sp. 5I2]WPX43091.1 hypothetical protein RHM61_17175 [Undibacterium sp. CCC3.4]